MKKVSDEIRIVHGTAMRMALVRNEDHIRTTPTTPVPGSYQILPDLTRSSRIFLDLTILTGFQLLKDLKERRSPSEKTAIHDMT